MAIENMSLDEALEKFGGGQPVRVHQYQSDDKSIGARFVGSEGYKSIQDSASRAERWSTGSVEVRDLGVLAKGTLLTTPGSAPTPAQYIPGVQQILTQPLTIADLLGSQQTTGSQVKYPAESAATNAAAAVSEGALKPESALTLEEKTEAVRKLATVLPVSEEMLEDAPAIQAYLNERLTLFVRITEEQQLLYGDGNAPNLSGILDRSGIQNHNRGTFTNIDAIRQMITKSRTSYLEPSFVVLHPAQWENIELLKNNDGSYYGDPFVGGPMTLWKLPVVVTNNIGAGTALVGSGQAATIWRKGGLRVEASNSDGDNFRRNLVSLRAEERLALAVYRESSFVRGTAMAA